MPLNDQPREKAVWHSPTIVDVGGVLLTTLGPDGNLRDNPGVEPARYVIPDRRSRVEVDLDGR